MTTAFFQGKLDVGAGHSLYFAEYGRPDGPAAVVLHGGPGSRCDPSMLDWFDLSRQRVVLFDQRGAGQSTPQGGLANNTTPDLLADIERLRRRLRIPDWLVVGGSWGAMLAVAYAGSRPQSVRGLVLRGVFLPGKAQLDWFFQSLQALVPVAWAQLTQGMSPTERRCVLSVLAHRLLHGTDAEQHETALRWGRYEVAVMAAMTGKALSPSHASRPAQIAKYRLQSHYLSQQCFTGERQLFRAARRITAPTIFVHGTNDWICPPRNVVCLTRFMPQAQVRWVSQGTHTPSDPAIGNALRTAIHDMQAELPLSRAKPY